MGNVYRVALAQMCSCAGNIRENTQKAISVMQQAKEQNADIVLFPECFLTGYFFPKKQEEDKWRTEAIDEKNDSLQTICQTAKKLNIAVVITAFTKTQHKPQNSAFVIDKRGNIILKYSKVHTCDFSNEAMLESGTEFKVCTLEGVKIGIMICYDREYPESARILMLKGAEIILVPNACELMKPRVQTLCVRAYENMVGVAMANVPGKKAGNSCAFSPIVWDKDENALDNTIVLADEESQSLFIADFDMDAIRKYRKTEMMGNTFRKVKAYKELLENNVQEPFIR